MSVIIVLSSQVEIPADHDGTRVDDQHLNHIRQLLEDQRQWLLRARSVNVDDDKRATGSDKWHTDNFQSESRLHCESGTLEALVVDDGYAASTVRCTCRISDRINQAAR